MITGSFLTLLAPSASAQTGSYLDLVIVPMFESDLDNGQCDYGISRDSSTLDAEIGDEIVLCYFIFNDDNVTGAGADALDSQLLDDNGTPNDTNDDRVIDLGTIEAGNTPIAQRSVTLSVPGQLNITATAVASNGLNDDDASNVDSVTVNVAGVVATTTTSTTSTPSTTSTTVQATTTTDVVVAGAVSNNQAQLPFTGAEDEMTSIWATALIAAGLALLVGTRRRLAYSRRFFEADEA